jgi:uncharacterized membrane protein YhaH (DUF805 family)
MVQIRPGRWHVRRREVWGTALTSSAALAFWWATVVWAAPTTDDAGRPVLFFFLGVSKDLVTGSIQIMSLIGGAIGLLLLVPALIRRIRRGWLRQTSGLIACAGAALALPCLALVFLFALLGALGFRDYVEFQAADGRSVLVTQDGFDGDIVLIYTKYDDFHYVQNRQATELSAFPRVKNRDCQLAAVDTQLVLTCGTETVSVDPSPSQSVTEFARNRAGAR